MIALHCSRWWWHWSSLSLYVVQFFMFIGGDGEIINSLCWMWVKPWQRLQIGGMDTNVHMHCMSLTHNYSSSSCDLKWYAGVHHVPLPFEVLRSQFMCCRNYEHWRAVRRDRQTDRQTEAQYWRNPHRKRQKTLFWTFWHFIQTMERYKCWSDLWNEPSLVDEEPWGSVVVKASGFWHGRY